MYSVLHDLYTISQSAGVRAHTCMETYKHMHEYFLSSLLWHITKYVHNELDSITISISKLERQSDYSMIRRDSNRLPYILHTQLYQLHYLISF